MPYYIGKGLREVDFKYPVDPLAGAFVKMGFADDREIDINGVRIVPRDVLMKLVPRPGDAFLNETETTLIHSGDYAWIMEITVDGIKDGARRSHCLTDLIRMDQDTKLRFFRRFGSSHIGVALPAVIGAKMCLDGSTSPGVISSECLDPPTFFKCMAGMGVPVSFNEIILKQTVFE